VAGSGAIDVSEVAGLLGSLVDNSLVAAEPAGTALRYRLLETIGLFAAEGLADNGEEAAAAGAAHCAHYLALAETAAPHLFGPQQGSWYDRLEADHANLRRAAEHAAGEPGGTTHVLRFGVALWRYWLVRSRREEAAALLVPLLSRPQAADDPALFAEALAITAYLATPSDRPTSLGFAEKAGQVASGLGDDRLLTLSRAILCWTLDPAGQPERPRPLGADSVQRARQLGDDVLLGLSLAGYALAVSAAASGQLYAEAFACTERSGDLFIEQLLHNNAGWDALETGDIPAARAHAEAAIQGAEALGTPHPYASHTLGLVLRAEHDLDGARSILQQALRIARRVGDKTTMAETILGLACVAGDLGHWHRAVVLHGAAQALLDQTGVPWVPFDARYRQESLDQAGAALSDEQFRQAYTRSMTLGFDQAMHLALGQVLPAT
jgi:tetratricopeptide (TPR) repeat protein